jgi:hypothetical protein
MTPATLAGALPIIGPPLPPAIRLTGDLLAAFGAEFRPVLDFFSAMSTVHELFPPIIVIWGQGIFCRFPPLGRAKIRQKIPPLFCLPL